MEKIANLKYWESIVSYIILGLVTLSQIVFFCIVYYSQHDTPLQKIKKKLNRKKEGKIP